MLDISYKDYRKKKDIHGTVLYPAVMIAPMQKDVLHKYIDKNEYTKIIDPFHGSGTSLYEAFEVSQNINIVGCDINPLANLITKVKLQGVDLNIDDDIDKIKQKLISSNTEKKHYFQNIEKWFREDIRITLSAIKYNIEDIETKKNRLFFWCMFCDIIRKYSNTRSSTYKLHIKNQENIDKMNNSAIEDFIKSIEENSSKYKKCFTPFELIKGNSLTELKKFNSNEFDICITSPPYGDNHTTVTYGQFSMLPLFWINENDLEFEGWEFKNYSTIDSHSLGGNSQKDCRIAHDLKIIKPYLEKISEKKQKKVIRFFNEYFISLEEICRITKTYVIMTLGNRTVDGERIELTKITKEFMETNGFIQIESHEREIVSKRMPRKIYTKENGTITSMNKEHLIIMKKN